MHTKHMLDGGGGGTDNVHLGLIYYIPTFLIPMPALIWNFRCNLHSIGNHCVKYEHPWSKKGLSFKP